MATAGGALAPSLGHDAARADTRAIEIKVNIEVGVSDALAGFGNPQPMTTRRIWFIENDAALRSKSPQLFSRRVILRVNNGDDGDASTARLRPIDPDDLVDEWARRFTTATTSYQIEGDWTGPHRAIAASVKSRHPRGAIAEALEAENFQSVLTPSQCKLVRDCTHTDLESSRLVALGPVQSSKWRTLWRGIAGAVDAERWTALDLDFLELSIRVTPRLRESPADFERRARTAQRDLIRDAARYGLHTSATAGRKTERMLRALAAAAAEQDEPDRPLAVRRCNENAPHS